MEVAGDTVSGGFYELKTASSLWVAGFGEVDVARGGGRRTLVAKVLVADMSGFGESLFRRRRIKRN